ncbi:ROK family transcriptional regulator [Clostridium beijerinckii]|uniref:ROK family transcriptional regulator n=1 Tax=Clostridium beijerinckii TaxID=1520 RepID=UPI0022E06C2C|nr:ROK family transcriptional regulator [Clostridium beijerinckii]
MALIKQENRASILEALKNNGTMSRKDIASIVQLTPAAVTILVNDMIKDGIIKEAGELEEGDKRVGRKKILIDINYNYKYVLGINIEAEQINIGVSNISGDIIAETSWATDMDSEMKPEVFLKEIADKCVNLFWKENILKESILGVGVGIVGLVDNNTGVSKHAYGLWRQSVHVKGILENALEIPVVVDNNVRALAVAEMDYKSEQDISDMLFVKHGPGIGSAMIVGKKIHYGANNKAGEIGHAIMNLEGELCKCGKRGCLETVASKQAILKNIKAIFSMKETPLLYSKCNGSADDISLDKVFEAAFSGGDRERKILRQVAVNMAMAISNAVSLYDPQQVILYGKTFWYEQFLNEFKCIIKEMILVEDLDGFITISKLNYKENYIGGIALAIRKFFFDVGGTL